MKHPACFLCQRGYGKLQNNWNISKLLVSQQTSFRYSVLAILNNLSWLWLILIDCQKCSWVPSALSAVPNGNVLYENGFVATSSSFASTWRTRPLQRFQLHMVGSRAVAKTAGPECSSYCCPSGTPVSSSLSKMWLLCAYLPALYCSAPSQSVTGLAANSFSPVAFNKWWHRILKMPWGLSVWTN